MRGLWFCVLFLFFTLISVIRSEGQEIQGAVIGGVNLAQVDGDEIFGFNKFGFNAGLAALAPVGKNFYLSIETLYNQKGSYQGPQYEDVDSLGIVTTGEYKVNLNYLEVPVLFLYNDKDIIIGGAGISYGRLISVSEYEHGQKIETTSLNSGPYNRNEFSILADIRFRIYKKLKFNIRYAYSLAKIRTRQFEDLQGNTWNRNQFNNVISFRLVYMFNEPPPLADTQNKNADF